MSIGVLTSATTEVFVGVVYNIFFFDMWISHLLRTYSVEGSRVILWFLNFFRLSIPDQVAYSEKTIEVKNLIDVGPSVKKVITVGKGVSCRACCGQ